MTRRASQRRTARFAAAFATACVLATTACNSTPPGPTIDPALSTLVPADTTMLIGIRVEDLTKTPIYKKYLAGRPLAPIDDFAKEFGVDPRKDLWELLFISNGTESELIGRGRFSNEAEPYVARELQGAKRTNYRGFSMVGNEQDSVLLMGPTIMGVGSTSGLKKLIDTRDKTNGPPESLLERMREIPPGLAVWGVTSGAAIDLPASANANATNLAKLLRSIQSGLMHVDLRNGISAKAVGVTQNDASAKQLYDAARGLQGLAQMMGGKDDKRMQNLLEGIRVTQEGERVNIYVEEQEDAVATLTDLFNSLAAGQGGRGQAGKGRMGGPGRGRQDDIPTPLE